ncbi:hypothetical protein [Streptomyces sp. NPDC058206]|uniref:hypothetical protein n=1 Tax=Streptomyces sp. NPDC058206 TaxID=3346382 RepID=UPI0036E86DCE
MIRVTSLPMTDFPRPAAPQAENPAQQRLPAAIGTARLRRSTVQLSIGSSAARTGQGGPSTIVSGYG